jgi:peroxiredoxin|tara:strand:- start:500 stop:1204 length:705 start_codon:yes stop_codon:yes gene_type:complete
MNLIPNAELFFVEKKKLVRKSTHELFSGRDVLVIGINGAFLPTDEQMVKDYEKLYLHFKDTTLVGAANDPTHIDDIYFVSLNDPYVMEAWWKKMKIKNCKYLADGSGAFTLRLDQQGGMTPGQTVVEMYNKGYGKRSWRYVLLMENNCQMCYVEEETPENVSTRDNLEDDLYKLTKPEEALKMLRARQQTSHIGDENKAADAAAYVPLLDLGTDPNNNPSKIKEEKVSDRMGLG